MRICYVCQDLGIPIGSRKGGAAHVRGLVAAFRDAGHEVCVVSAAPVDGADLGVPLVPVALPAVATAVEAAGKAVTAAVAVARLAESPACRRTSTQWTAA